MEYELTDAEIKEAWLAVDNEGYSDFRKADHYRVLDYEVAIAKAAQKKLVGYMERNWKGYEDKTVGHLLGSTLWKSLRKGVGLED